MTELTRVYRFSASHRLHVATLTEEENDALYGKCNNPYGHGHNYELHVGVSGLPDPRTGRIVDPGALDSFVGAKVLDVLDGNDMNSDVPGFQGVPTTENLAEDVARRLQDGWAEMFGAVNLCRVFVRETQRNTFELRIR